VCKAAVLTPSFPRYPGDYHGGFIKTLCDKLSQHLDIEVIAPRSKSCQPLPTPYKVKRFKYLPLQRMELIAESTLVDAKGVNIAPLPLYLSSAYLSLQLNRYDLVHTHLALPLGLASTHSLRKTPNIITCHGSDITYAGSKPQFKPFLRHVLKKADRVVAVSNHIKRQAIEAGANPEKITTIYMGVDTEKFSPLERKGGNTVGTLGRLTPDKNVIELIQAARYLSGDIKVVVGGDGPELECLKQTCRELGVKSAFLGRVSNQVGFHRMIDVFVLTSKREGLSISLQEAMACSAIPVTIKGQGCEEVIENGVNGFFYDAGDPRNLAETIEKALNHREAARKARETIVERFNIKQTVARYLEEYRRLIE